jgi:hypothetical protein
MGVLNAAFELDDEFREELLKHGWNKQKSKIFAKKLEENLIKEIDSVPKKISRMIQYLRERRYDRSERDRNNPYSVNLKDVVDKTFVELGYKPLPPFGVLDDTSSARTFGFVGESSFQRYRPDEVFLRLPNKIEIIEKIPKHTKRIPRSHSQHHIN